MLSSPFFGVNVRNTLCVTADREQPRHPRPAAIGDLDPDQALPDRHRLPGKTRAAMPHTVAEKLASSTATSPADHAVHEGTGDPHPPRQPRKRHALPNQAAAPSLAARPGNIARARARTRGMQARLSDACQGGTRPGGPCPWPSVEADGPPHRSSQPDAIRYMSVDPATRRSTSIQGDTQRDKAKRPA